ncbi:hypothetical protein CLAIMM_15156 [Cladophialophora immunda]|nr:hypothetical protein CLAIMM_15156 [Cladophialophora immunda]
MARLLPKTPADCPTDEQALVETCQQFVQTAFGPNGSKFIYKDSRGGLIGPFPFFLHDPTAAPIFLQLIGAMAKLTGLPQDARDTVVLTVASKFRAGYALYSHGASSTQAGTLSREQVGELSKGAKPADLNEGCGVAYDAATYLMNTPGPLPQAHWDKLVQHFGKDGTVGFVHHVGFYSYVSVILNSIDAPVPAPAPA